MIKRLRLKFVCITMALITVVLLALFGFLLWGTHAAQRDRTEKALEIALQQAGGGKGFQRPQISLGEGKPQGLPDRPPDIRTASFWVKADPDGVILESGRGDVDISDDTLEAVVQKALDADKAEGTLNDANLRYRVLETPSGFLLAFADQGEESSAVRTLAAQLLLAGIGVEAIFCILCIFLARWALRPVERAWDVQRQFVADASHELKTPLTVILANTQILLSHPEETVLEKRQWVEGTLEEGTRMRILIDELLFLAKSDAARAPVCKGAVDFSDTVWESELSLESVAFEQGVTIEAQITPGLRVEGDGMELRRLAVILLENACKYAGGGKTVTVTLESRKEEAVLTVANPGTPIPEKDLPHLFERFYRVEQSRAREAGGFGLGLAIAKTIAESHRGSIRAESDKESTRFYVRIPLLKDAR